MNWFKNKTIKDGGITVDFWNNIKDPYFRLTFSLDHGRPGDHRNLDCSTNSPSPLFHLPLQYSRQNSPQPELKVLEELFSFIFIPEMHTYCKEILLFSVYLLNICVKHICQIPSL